MDPQGLVRKNGYNWTFASTSESALMQYSIQGVPTTLFIDRSGSVVETVVGGMGVADFEARLAKIL
jgi:hypothetical protein